MLRFFTAVADRPLSKLTNRSIQIQRMGNALINDYLLPFRTTLYPLAGLSLALLLAIFALEASEPRAWCRRLCPLGTLLALTGRLSPFKRVPNRLCSDCSACRELCPSAFDRDILQSDSCIRCQSCVSGCQQGRARFRWSQPQLEREYLPSRRVLLGGIVSGFALARLFRYRQPEAQARLLRPPGVLEEREFLAKCVRCGECLKVCLKSALYPAAFQAGAEGLYTPPMTGGGTMMYPFTGGGSNIGRAIGTKGSRLAR